MLEHILESWTNAWTLRLSDVWADEDADFTSGLYTNMRKLQFWIHASPDISWQQLHTTAVNSPKGFTYQAGRHCRNRWNTYCFKYNHRSSEKLTSICKKNKHPKTKIFFHSSQATPNSGMLIFHFKTVHIAVPLAPDASLLFTWCRTHTHTHKKNIKASQLLYDQHDSKTEASAEKANKPN